jgi:hypothetical protein
MEGEEWRGKVGGRRMEGEGWRVKDGEGLRVKGLG